MDQTAQEKDRSKYRTAWDHLAIAVCWHMWSQQSFGVKYSIVVTVLSKMIATFIAGAINIISFQIVQKI